jgi:hypothetical protein
MKLSSLLLFAIGSVAVFTLSCKKENKDPLIFVSPNNTQINVEPNQIMEFSIKMTAAAGLNNLRITRNVNNTVTQTVLDTALTGENLTITFPYQVPTAGVNQVYFVFRLTDKDGREVATPRKLVVIGNALLVETTGHVMFSAFASNSLSAFNISNSNVFQLLESTDSAIVDIKDFDNTDDGVLAKSWASGHGLKFVRNNSFDYANATFATAKASYTSSTPVEILNNITVNDKIIVRYGGDTELYAVFDVLEIHDVEGSDNDRYRFNLKK